ncbi:MAG: SGNH/GDSL hydrolase family protein [Myxococcota bacterium]
MWTQRTLLLTLLASVLGLGCGDATSGPALSQNADVSTIAPESSDSEGGQADATVREPLTDAVTGATDVTEAPGPVDTATEEDAAVTDEDTEEVAPEADTSDASAEDTEQPQSDAFTGDDVDGPEADATIDDDATSSADVSAPPDVEAPAPGTINELCFSEFYDPEEATTDYDQYAPVIGSHCVGTNHQAITDIEQVVILGDSVTQGTPNDVHPTCLENNHFFRNKLSEWLADTYNLDTGDLISWGLFKSYNCLYDGTPGQQTSGDFHNCSKWGAKTDDFIAGGGQIPQCFPGYPEVGSDKTTLVFFTMGGNDIAYINQAGFNASEAEVAAGYPEVWAAAESAIGYLEEAMAFLKDPVAFPNGVHVVFANPFEFTDGTGETSACSPSEINIPFVGPLDISAFGIDLAGLAGYGAWEDQSVQEAVVIWMMEQYMRIAVDYQADLVWLLESFCGHGFVATGPDADTENRCYRGPDAELYFDISCTHPSKAGHHALSELFKAVISE